MAQMAAVNEKAVPHTTQPAPVAQMTLPGNRNVLNLPLDTNGKRSWSYGLFSCFGDMNKCCMACWCPCASHGQIKKRLEHLNTRGFPDPQPNEFFTEHCLLDLLLDITCELGWVLQIPTRKNIRQRYNIQGSALGDCCAPFLCQPCNLVQASRELQLEENNFALTTIQH